MDKQEKHGNIHTKVDSISEKKKTADTELEFINVETCCSTLPVFTIYICDILPDPASTTKHKPDTCGCDIASNDKCKCNTHEEVSCKCQQASGIKCKCNTSNHTQVVHSDSSSNHTLEPHNNPSSNHTQVSHNNSSSNHNDSSSSHAQEPHKSHTNHSDSSSSNHTLEPHKSHTNHSDSSSNHTLEPHKSHVNHKPDTCGCDIASNDKCKCNTHEEVNCKCQQASGIKCKCNTLHVDEKCEEDMKMPLSTFSLSESDILNDTDAYQTQCQNMYLNPMEMTGCVTYSDLSDLERKRKTVILSQNWDMEYLMKLYSEVKDYLSNLVQYKGENDPKFVRKSLGSLSALEITAYKNAFQVLNKEAKVGQGSFLGRLIAIHQGTMVHGTPYFFHWHRWFIAIFESALNAAGSALPYWDTTEVTAIPTGLLNFMPAINMPPIRTSSGQLKATAKLNITRNFRSSQLPTTKDFKSAFANTKFVTSQDGTPEGNSTSGFSYHLELLHNQVHIAIGGTMNNIRISPADCLFWMHHANIDLCLEMWNRLGHTDIKPLKPTLPIPGFEGLTVGDVMDIDEIVTQRGSGYTYILNRNWSKYL